MDSCTFEFRQCFGLLSCICVDAVIMQAFKEPPPDMVCKDKFLIQSTAVPAETTDEDITASMVSIQTLVELLYPEFQLFGLSSISVYLFILGSFPKGKANT